MVITGLDKTAETYNLIGYEERDSMKNNRNTLNYEGECTISWEHR